MPADGDKFRSGVVGFDLTVAQEGDQNLIYQNVVDAIQQMIDYYKSQQADLVLLSEVHVLYNFYLEGTVTIGFKEEDCRRLAIP